MKIGPFDKLKQEPEQVERMKGCDEAFKTLLDSLERYTSPCPEMHMAVHYLQMASMMVNRGISINPESPLGKIMKNTEEPSA